MDQQYDQLVYDLMKTRQSWSCPEIVFQKGMEQYDQR